MNTDRLVENNALPFAAALLADDHRGFECVVVVARLAWQLTPNGRARIATPQRPIRIDPVFRDGATSSLRFGSDKVCEKPGTELLMLARAWPPIGNTPSQLDVSLRVETGSRSLRKGVRVFGPRRFVKKVVGVTPGQAGPIDGPIPIIYELAEGGSAPAPERDQAPQRDQAGQRVPAGQRDNEPLSDPINPVGRGFAGDKRELVDTEAYQIEPVDGQRPAGFGPIARHWSPRKELFGTLSDDYYQKRYPVAPADLDVRYYCDGHPDLWSEEPLRGDEPIEIIGATPEGTWSFKLPYYLPRFDLVMQGQPERRLDTKLDSIVIDIENEKERIVELTWRASVRMPKKSEMIEKIRVTNAVDIPRHYYDELLNRAEHSHHTGMSH